MTPDEARELAETGIRITRAANEQLGFSHPENPEWNHISFCQLTAPVERNATASCTGATPWRSSPARSTARRPAPAARPAWPCSTPGPDARRRQRSVGNSIIGSHFDCRIVGETTVGGRPAIVPEISGRAWVTGTHQVMLDPADPWPTGYRLSDTWPHKQ